MHARSKVIAAFTSIVQEIVYRRTFAWGDSGRLKVAPTAHMASTVFNLTSGSIEVGDHTFTGHNVLIITGTHVTEGEISSRWTSYPLAGRDIRIGSGVWMGSSVVILGPCSIGDDAVIGAGSVVLAGTEVPPNELWAGIPARRIRSLAPDPDTGGE